MLPVPCALPACRSAVDVALQAMQRQQEAVVCCPTSLLCGGQLLPEPPDAPEGAAHVDYAEFKLQLLDFSQVDRRPACLSKQLPARPPARLLACLPSCLPAAAAPFTTPPTNPQPAPASSCHLCFSGYCLAQVRDMTGDSQVVKRIVRKGVGEFPMDCPLEDSKVQVHYR